MDTQQFDPNYVPAVALGVAAHPDDLDFGMAGTVAAWADAGCKVYYLVLTNGNKGTEDRTIDPKSLTKLRRNEQRAAAHILGVADVFFCDYEDGGLEVTQDVKRDIARVIRRVKPEVVLTFDPTMVYDVQRSFINHPDHRAAGQATIDAVFPLARDHLSFPELLKEGLEPHKTASLYLLNFATHNVAVDISNTITRKMDALEAHASQVPHLDDVQRRMRDVARGAGKAAGVQYAETFLRIDISA